MPATFGKFELLERIRIGGIAEVFRGRVFGTAGFNKPVIIKRILPQFSNDELFIEAFINEAKVSAHLNHSNICQIYDFGKVARNYFICMEYIKGYDLSTIQQIFFKRREHLPIPLVVRVALKILGALDHAHTKHDNMGAPLNIVHCAMKPRNVLLGLDGAVKVLNFGIANIMNHATRTAPQRSEGKFEYLSPEQVEGAPADLRSDLFSLGIIMWELLTNRSLFLDQIDLQTLDNVMKADIPPPSTLNPLVTGPLDDIVLKALSRTPERRFQSADDFHDILEQFARMRRIHFSSNKMSRWMKGIFSNQGGSFRTDMISKADMRKAVAEAETGGPIRKSPSLRKPARDTSEGFASVDPLDEEATIADVASLRRSVLSPGQGAGGLPQARQPPHQPPHQRPPQLKGSPTPGAGDPPPRGHPPLQPGPQAHGQRLPGAPGHQGPPPLASRPSPPREPPPGEGRAPVPAGPPPQVRKPPRPSLPPARATPGAGLPPVPSAGLNRARGKLPPLPGSVPPVKAIPSFETRISTESANIAKELISGPVGHPPPLDRDPARASVLVEEAPAYQDDDSTVNCPDVSELMAKVDQDRAASRRAAAREVIVKEPVAEVPTAVFDHETAPGPAAPLMGAAEDDEPTTIFHENTENNAGAPPTFQVEDEPPSFPGQDEPPSFPGQDEPPSFPGQDEPPSFPGESTQKPPPAYFNEETEPPPAPATPLAVEAEPEGFTMGAEVPPVYSERGSGPESFSTESAGGPLESISSLAGILEPEEEEDVKSLHRGWVKPVVLVAAFLILGGGAAAAFIFLRGSSGTDETRAGKTVARASQPGQPTAKDEAPKPEERPEATVTPTADKGTEIAAASPDAAAAPPPGPTPIATSEPAAKSAPTQDPIFQPTPRPSRKASPRPRPKPRKTARPVRPRPVPAEVPPKPAPAPAPAGDKGKLIIASKPWSYVDVDGTPTGRSTPIALSRPLMLSPGRHKITLSVGYQRFTFTVDIKPGEVTKLIRKLPVVKEQ